MPLNQNPANNRLASDLKFFRRKIKTPGPNDPNASKDIRKHLNKRNPGKYAANPPGGQNDDILTAEAYRDFASWQTSLSNSTPNRLGGGLDAVMPSYLELRTVQGQTSSLDNLPAPTGTEIEWNPPENHPKITVSINAGAVVHRTAAGVEIHDAHHYMHGIFDHILYNIRGLLEGINRALEAYAEKISVTTPNPPEAADYTTAVKAFDDYVVSLQPGGSSPLAVAFNFVGVNPVVTNEGFIVSCRVKLNWRNPYHSSSTIKVP